MGSANAQHKKKTNAIEMIFVIDSEDEATKSGTHMVLACN